MGDLPFGSFEADPKLAFSNAARLLKEGGMDAVKIEGGKGARMQSLKTVVEGGVAVMGHIGLTPQSFSALGGFRAQGRTAKQALGVLQDALAVQEAGAFAIVIECVPAIVAGEITKRLEIPTIGIGSGNRTDGQVLVYHDLLGMMQHPWHAAHALKFCKQYAAVGSVINQVRSLVFLALKAPFLIIIFFLLFCTGACCISRRSSFWSVSRRGLLALRYTGGRSRSVFERFAKS